MGEGALWPGLSLYTAYYAFQYKRFGTKSFAAYKAAFVGYMFFILELSRVRTTFEITYYTVSQHFLSRSKSTALSLI